MLRVHMFSKRIFLYFRIITLHTFPSYASSSQVFKKNLFVFPQNRIAHISIICFEFTCFRNYYFCVSTKSHCTHFRHMLRVHMFSKLLFLCFHKIALHTFSSYASSSHELENTHLFHNKVTLITFPSLANALYSHSLLNSFLFEFVYVCVCV